MEFPGVRALDGVSLDLDKGSIHALCGENGAGKSTLLKILAGCHPQGTYGGSMEMDGHELAFSGPRAAETAGIALVAQELNLVPELSVAENLCLGQEPGTPWRVDWAAARELALQSMSRVGLDEDPSRQVGELSVGRQQLVEIARALGKRARILILDEPTAALTDADAGRLLELLKGLSTEGCTILYVSHRLDEVLRIADTITVLRDGKSVRSGPIQSWDRDSLVRDMVGRELEPLLGPSAGASAPGPTALEIRHWNVKRTGLSAFHALQDVAFSLGRGEILGVGGLMGSGRTALLSTLFGDWRGPIQGELRLDGSPWRAPFRSPGEALAAGVCLVGEDRKRMGLVGGASVMENLALGTLVRFSHALSGLDWRALALAAQAQADALQVRASSLTAEASTLSGGNQQKLLLGRWLLLGPKVLLLDEPTRGIDVGARAEIYQVVRSLAAQGMAVLLASSDMSELLALSHRILVLSQGRLSAELAPSEFSQEAVMRAATKQP
jgi:D-xylose transport system ATP-binding protein